MRTQFYPASQRGHVNFGWLDSHHSFSFGNWHDPEKVHFGALRVLNDDIVKGGKGFDTHPHDNMEIVSIPLKGALAHKDSTGTEGIIYSGDVQIMSAGSGIRHSEYNASHYDPVNFLQIWVFPKQRNIKPRHDQKTFDPAAREGKWQVVVSPDEKEGGVWINQDARFAITRLKAGKEIPFTPAFPGNGVYIFVLEGEVTIGDIKLERRDGLGISATDSISIQAGADSEILAIEVPMFA
ncbi:MAG: pirin family protein [Bacteroidota bacterium]|nr:pirin family protein [Bacteroidota bacterium]MDP4247292.1 pirin family protein [Bacteroidota bacterium]MDP4258992.1 pirin family protein [Bacteroidota bacterium]